jgi:hypothetical protein
MRITLVLCGTQPARGWLAYEIHVPVEKEKDVGRLPLPCPALGLGRGLGIHETEEGP